MTTEQTLNRLRDNSNLITAHATRKRLKELEIQIELNRFDYFKRKTLKELKQIKLETEKHLAWQLQNENFQLPLF